MGKFEQTVQLPTNGFFYDEDNNITEVTLRDITTKEEKMLLGSTSDNTMTNVIKACIVSPKFDLDDLITPDIHYLLMQLRIHTYGSSYKVQFTCPNCGNRETEAINLDEMICYTLEEPFKQPFEFKLPVSGDTLGCKLLTNRDSRFINNMAKKLSKSSPQNRSQVSYNLRMAKQIVTINGEEMNDGQTQRYVQEMHGRDSAYFWWKMNSIKIGYDTDIEHTCSNCGTDFDIAMPISAEFFRPTFD